MQPAQRGVHLSVSSRTSRRRVSTALACAFLVGGLLATAPTAEGAYPGSNGKIAFERGVPRHIFVMNADGSNVVDLGPGADPAWSPDGSRIAFEEGVDIWVMNADGSDRHRITDDPASTRRVSAPTWSPDGSLIAFNADGTKIFVVPAVGGNVRLLIDPPETVGAPAWSPLGDAIAFGVTDIWLVNPDGTNLRNVTNTPDKYERDPDWRPDGSRIVFERGQPEEIWTMNPDGSGQTNITPAGASGGSGDPAWSPDGMKTVFVWNGIRVMNSDGTGVTAPITTGLRPDWQPTNSMTSTSTSSPPTSSSTTSSSTTSSSTTSSSTSSTSTSSTVPVTTSSSTTSTSTTSPLPSSLLRPTCFDGIDNDGDGRTDWRPSVGDLLGAVGSATVPPGDPGCSSPQDTSELVTTHCDDGIDNDGDGRIDFRVGAKAAEGDAQCSGPGDISETETGKGPADGPPSGPISTTSVCFDGIDNDGDGRTDWRPSVGDLLGGGSLTSALTGDPGCSSPQDTSELGSTQCDDGIDNDGDGRIDFRVGAKAAEGDAQCSGPGDNSEGPDTKGPTARTTDKEPG